MVHLCMLACSSIGQTVGAYELSSDCLAVPPVPVLQVAELQHAVRLEQMAHSDAGALREQASALQQQAASLQADLAAARQEAAGAAQRASELEQQLRRQEAAASAAADSGASTLAARLEAAQQAQQQLARQAEDLGGQLAAAQQRAEEACRAAAVAEAELRQLHERLAASERQRGEALEAVEQQSAAMAGLQAALDRLHMQEGRAAEASAAQQRLAQQLASAQQQLATVQQAAAVAQKQAEVLRAQAGKAEAEAARATAEKRHLANREAAVAEALQRYQRGVAVLSSTLQQLQATGPGLQAADDQLLALLQASASGGGGAAGGSGMAVEQLVDEILLQVRSWSGGTAALGGPLLHPARLLGSELSQQSRPACLFAAGHRPRQCCPSSSLLPNTGKILAGAPPRLRNQFACGPAGPPGGGACHPGAADGRGRGAQLPQDAGRRLPPALQCCPLARPGLILLLLASAHRCMLANACGRVSCSHNALPARLQAKQQRSQQSLGRLREQLHWSGKEAEALKRQLGDRDGPLGALGRKGPLPGGTPGGSAAGTLLRRQSPGGRLSASSGATASTPRGP